jgi:UDP-glucose 4-epimerase
VYGPGSRHKGSVVAAFYNRLAVGEPLIVYGDGAQVRDFIYIDDLCDGVIAAMGSAATGVVQLGSGRPVSISNLIETMRVAIAPTPLRVIHKPARAGEVAATWCDISKARSVLSFAPDTPLADGLKRTWRWFADENQQTIDQ